MKAKMHATPILFDLPGYDVVIPCFDRAHVVADAVASVLTQDPPPRRVVVVDDGSRDGSAHVIRTIATRYDCVEAVVLPRNGGASNARNAGVALCSAPWVAFLDSDDIWLPGAARALLSAPNAHVLDVIVGHFARVEGDDAPGDPECAWGGTEIRRALASGGVIGPSWSIVRRETVMAVGGFDPSFHNCNDWDFYTRAAATGARFGRIEATVALYRTVLGDRLVNDHIAGAENAHRVRAHPYLAELCEPYSWNRNSAVKRNDRG